MNIIDLAVLGVLALCVVIGLHRGFVRSILSVGACILSLVLVVICLAPTVRWVKANTSAYEQILQYCEGSQLINNTEVASRDAESFTQDELDGILSATRLPKAVITPIKTNIQKLLKSEEGATSLADYIDHTLADLVINVAVFIALYLIITIVLQVALSLANNVLKLPVLRHLDGLLGGLGGLLIGILVVLVIFLAVPVLQSVLPIDSFAEMVNKSGTARVVQSLNFLLGTVMRSFVTGG